MAYGNKYIISSSTELNERYDVYLDYLNYTGNSYPIISALDGLILRSTTGDQDRFATPLGLECILNIVVGKARLSNGLIDDTQLTIFDLIAQQDNQIRVTVYKNQDLTKSVFQGFVVVEDNQQPFLDPPFTLTVRALDGLGLLKGVDLVNTLGGQFVGAMSPIGWLANILYKTGQTLNIRCYFNIVNTITLSIPPMVAFTIPASTFQTGQPQTTTDPTIDISATIADDCASALEVLCRCLRSRLFQQDGVWNFVNIWEYQNPNGYSFIEYHIENPDGAGICLVTPVNRVDNANYDSLVGSNQIIHPVKDDAILSLKLATKSIKLNYTYDQSLNKICNQNLQSGDPDVAHNGTISSTFENPAIQPPITFTYLAYQAFCFTHLDGPGAFHPYPGIAPTAPSYIRDVQDINGYSLDRYLMIAKPTSILTYERSSKFQIDIGDVLNMTFDWRTKENENVPSGTGVASVAYILLYGIDGTFWALEYAPQGTNKPTWLQCPDNTFQIGGNTPALSTPQFIDSAANGYTNCTTVLQAPSGFYYGTAPVSGDIEVLFLYLRDQLPAPTEYWFKNITITIIPFINGSFKPLKGDFNFSSSNQNIKQTLTEDVEISDSRKRYFKGALLQTDGQTLMPNTWVRSDYPALTPKRFTKLMEQIMYNALYRQFQMIEGTFRGLTYVTKTYDVKEAGYLNSYYFTNHPVPTKKFMLTSFEKDYGTGMGRHVFVEILNDVNDSGQIEPDNYLFITNLQQ